MDSKHTINHTILLSLFFKNLQDRKRNNIPVLPSSKMTFVGRSCARIAEKNAFRVLRSRIAARRPRLTPTADPTVVHSEIEDAAALSLSRSPD